MLYKNLNFAGNKSKQYSAVRESVAATYSAVQAYSSGMRNFYINMRTILLLGEPPGQVSLILTPSYKCF